MSLQREYAERYDWLLTQFRDWAFTFTASALYYEDYDKLDEPSRNLYRQGMAAFGGIAPTYHIALLDKPTIVWDFHSLLLGIQMMFSFMLTDGQKPLRICKHCQKAYAANHPNALFCSPRCKNQYNVYKSRANKASSNGGSNSNITGKGNRGSRSNYNSAGHSNSSGNSKSYAGMKHSSKLL